MLTTSWFIPKRTSCQQCGILPELWAKKSLRFQIGHPDFDWQGKEALFHVLRHTTIHCDCLLAAQTSGHLLACQCYVLLQLHMSAVPTRATF